MCFLPVWSKWGRNSMRSWIHVALPWIKLPVTSSSLWVCPVWAVLVEWSGLGAALSSVLRSEGQELQLTMVDQSCKSLVLRAFTGCSWHIPVHVLAIQSPKVVLFGFWLLHRCFRLFWAQQPEKRPVLGKDLESESTWTA